ncbi:MAG: D-glycero-beta-D-manno-heptose 1-phosphate adenylyltransferase [Candidatus Marinimicrobia bacterium]|nr:D-glycero-beta-D-manno-heptose 1-phosphate adenylyltransferase [Candidatus Neomarinimicrobiota bacterium]
MKSIAKIVSRKELIGIVRKLQTEGKRVVFTNGCFDILHVGHIDLLEKAKSYGDCLVVGLNSDSSVKKIKGKGRPILPERDRARLVAALQVVDFVVFFDEETPYEILKEIKPDILVKGGDYRFEEIVGHDLIPVVKIVPLTKEKSTTNIIAKILLQSSQST